MRGGRAYKYNRGGTTFPAAWRGSIHPFDHDPGKCASRVCTRPRPIRPSSMTLVKRAAGGLASGIYHKGPYTRLELQRGGGGGGISDTAKLNHTAVAYMHRFGLVGNACRYVATTVN